MKRCPICGGACLPSQSFCPACGSTLKAAALIEGDPYVGVVFANKYMMEEKLGEGGMGVVYKARTLDLGRSVAIKVLHERYSSDRSAIRRFTREAHVASRLNHPNSISILDFGNTSSGLSYLVMEFLEGRSLEEVLSREEMSLARSIHIMRQILSALEAAHVLGIVHRDLKPANIHLLSTSSRPDYVKVLDFGIARLRRGEGMDRLTRTGMVCGTPEYMSPEQAGARDTDARSDVYSAGLVFYEMLTGMRAFEGKSPAEIMSAQIHDMPVAPSLRNSERLIPPSLDAIVMWALAKQPDERFPSIREFSRVLKEWVNVSGPDVFKDAEYRERYAGASGKRGDPISVFSADIVASRPIGDESGTGTGAEFTDLGRVPADELPTRDAEFMMRDSDCGMKFDDERVNVPYWSSVPPSVCPFVGRRALLGFLEKEVAAGGFRVYRFSGPVGVGKTRTAQELMARIAAEGRRPVRSLLPSWAVFEPLEAVQNVALQLLGLPCEPVDKGHLEAHLAAEGFSTDLVDGLSLLFLPGTGHGERIPDEPDVTMLRLKRAESWRSLVIEAARRQPLVLLFDELERMDGASRELLLALAAAETDAPLTVLITHDEGFFSLWPDNVKEIVVNPLDSVECEDMVKILSQNNLKNEVVGEIVCRSEGNPLHARELTAFRSLHTIDEPPGNLPDLVAARFNRLTGEAKLRLQIASIISERIKRNAIAAIESSMGTPFPELEKAVSKSLETMESLGFVASETGRKVFLHGLHRQVVSSGIPAGVKMELHKRAARLLGGQGAGTAALAYHCWSAGAVEGAMRCLLNAGAAALKALDEEDAEVCYRRVLEKIKGPDATLSGLQGEIWIKAVRGLAEALKRSGDPVEAEQLLNLARRRATRIGWKTAEERLRAPLQGVGQEKDEPS